VSTQVLQHNLRYTQLRQIVSLPCLLTEIERQVFHERFCERKGQLSFHTLFATTHGAFVTLWKMSQHLYLQTELQTCVRIA